MGCVGFVFLHAAVFRPSSFRVFLSPQEERVPRTDFEIPYRELSTRQLIGQGAFGRVFSGRWRGTPVAVKMLVCQQLTPDVIKEFRAEVAVLR